MAFSYGWLLDPVSKARFCGEYLEKEVLHISGRSPDRYARLFATDEPERLLWRHDPEIRRSTTMLLRGEQIFPPSGLTNGQLSHWADGHYKRGATLLINHVGGYVDTVAQLQRAVEELVGASVNSHMFLTPEQAQGFEAHFDEYDIIILQIAGRKRWRLYEPPVSLPTRELHRFVAADKLGRPTHELLLGPGDLLYFPRGVVHEARTAGEPSLHLTLGFVMPTWAELLRESIGLASNSLVALRRSYAVTPEPGPELAGVVTALKSLFSALGEKGADAPAGDFLQEARDRIAARFVASLSTLPGSRLEAGGVRPIRATDEWVERVPGMLMHVKAAGGTVGVTLPGVGALGHGGTRVAFKEPFFMEPALNFIAASAAPFRISDLPLELSDESKVEFVRHLVTLGLLRKAAPVTQQPAP